MLLKTRKQFVYIWVGIIFEVLRIKILHVVQRCAWIFRIYKL